MTKLGELLKSRRTQKGLTQAEVAVLCGWAEDTASKDSNGRVSNYESGQRKPKISQLPVLAQVLEISPAELLSALAADSNVNFSVENGVSEESGTYTKETVFEVPFYDFEDIPHIATTEPARFERKVAADLTHGTFATQFYGDSMAPVSGPGILDGSIIFVEPSVKPKHRSIVLVLIDGKPIVRQYKIDGAEVTLSALNEKYKQIPMPSNAKVLGVIRHSKLSL